LASQNSHDIEIQSIIHKDTICRLLVLQLPQAVLSSLNHLPIIPNPSPPRLPEIAPLLRSALVPANLLQPRAQLDDREPEHARLQLEDAADLGLGRRVAVEPHDEVVARVGARAAAGEALGGLGQGEDAPVGYAADDAAGGED